MIMKTPIRLGLSLAALFLLAAPSRLAAQGNGREFGVAGGGSIFLNKSFDSPAGSGTAGFGNSFGVATWFGQDLYRLVSGELRYMYENNGLKLEAEGQKVSMSGRSHAVHYDILIHTSGRGSKVRPFVVVGGGIKGYFGTGGETAIQPLQDYAVLTHTSEWKPLVAFGGGVKFHVSESVRLRIELRDYATPFPKKVILPGPGSDLGGWIHNLTPMFGIGITF